MVGLQRLLGFGFLNLEDILFTEGVHDAMKEVLDALDILKYETDEWSIVAAQVAEYIIGTFGDWTSSTIAVSDAQKELGEELVKLELEIMRSAALYDAQSEARQRTQERIISSYRDTYHAADSMRGAHCALNHALNGTYSETMSQLDAFNAVMNLRPSYMKKLFDEEGALVDVEEAVCRLTQAQIELMGATQAKAIIESARAWQEANGSLAGYRATVLDATRDVWDFVDAQLALLRAGEGMEAYYRNVGGVYMRSYRASTAGASAEFRDLENQIEAVRNMTTSAGAAARERGTFRSDGALLVSDPVNQEIRGEIIRLHEDIAERRFFGGAFQQNMPAPNISLGGISVYAAAGMDEKAVAEQAAVIATDMVAECMEEYYYSDLKRGQY